MEKQYLLDIINNFKSNYSIIIKQNYPEIYSEINSKYSYPKFSQRLYHYIFGDDIGKCLICGQQCKFGRINEGYLKYCSYKCSGLAKHEISHETRNCIVCNAEFNVYKNTKKEYCSDNCRILGRAQKLPYTTKCLNCNNDVKIKSPESKKKFCNNICKESYKTSHPISKEELVAKVKNTKKEKYGDENYNNRQKFLDTMNILYDGCTLSSGSKLIEQVKQTKKEKYGDENYNNPIKRKNTYQEKYGLNAHPNVISSLKSRLRNKEIGYQSETYINTMLDKYGVIHPSKNKLLIQKREISRRKTIYQRFISNDRFRQIVIPLFTEEEYLTNKELYEFQCCKCNEKFTSNLVNGIIPRCYRCYSHNISTGHKELLEYLKTIYFKEILVNTRSIIKPLELDIYIPDLKLAIEYNGLRYHSECSAQMSKDYHMNKTKKCEELGIHLIHIYDCDWHDKQEIIKNRLQSIINVPRQKIYARKCIIKEIPSSDASIFLDTYHFQGNIFAKVNLGAYYNNTLVAVMNFSNLRMQKGRHNEFELLRYCNHPDYICVGVADKLLQYFISKYAPSNIISYADRSWTNINNNIYKRLGFSLVEETSPGYWYHKYDYKRHRYQFRKSELSKKLLTYDPALTEWQNMQLNGYDRVWDSGNLKYILRLP